MDVHCHCVNSGSFKTEQCDQDHGKQDQAGKVDCWRRQVRLHSNARLG